MAVIIIADTEISDLAHPLHLIEAIPVQKTRWESLIRTLRESAFSDVCPKEESSPYGLGRSEELLATGCRDAFCA